MTDTIEVHIDRDGEMRRVGSFRYVSRRRRRSSVFEYPDEWLKRGDAFAIDPGNLPLEQIRIYTSQELIDAINRQREPDLNSGAGRWAEYRARVTCQILPRIC